MSRAVSNSKPLHHTVRRPFLINTKGGPVETCQELSQAACLSITQYKGHSSSTPKSCPKQHASPSHSTKAIPHQHQRASAALLPVSDNATDAFKTNILQGMKYENCNVTLCIKCRYNIFTCSGQVVKSVLVVVQHSLKPGVHTNDFATIHGRAVRIHTAPAEDNTSNQQSTPQALCEYGRGDRESWRNR